MKRRCTSEYPALMCWAQLCRPATRPTSVPRKTPTTFSSSGWMAKRTIRRGCGWPSASRYGTLTPEASTGECGGSCTKRLHPSSSWEFHSLTTREYYILKQAGKTWKQWAPIGCVAFVYILKQWKTTCALSFFHPALFFFEHLKWLHNIQFICMWFFTGNTCLQTQSHCFWRNPLHSPQPRTVLVSQYPNQLQGPANSSPRSEK